MSRTDTASSSRMRRADTAAGWPYSTDSHHFSAVEFIREYGQNVMSFELSTGARWWYIIGCYLAPDETSTIDRVVAALRDRPKGTALVVAGDLNMDLEDSENDRRGTEIAAAMTATGVEDMTAH